MRKLLAILSAITLTASASTTVVSCATKTNDNSDQMIANNSIPNMTGAAFEKAKSVILDDQFGFAQSLSMEQINNNIASDKINDFDDKDGTLNDDSMVGDVVDKYIQTEDVNKSETTMIAKSMKLGNKNGQESLIESLLPDSLKPIIKPIEDAITFLMKNSEQFVSASNLDNAITALSSSNINDTINGLLGSLQTVLPTIDGVLEKGSETFTSLFGKISPDIKGIIFELLSNDGMKEMIYGEDEDSLGNIKVQDVKTEILKSVANILSSLINSTETYDDGDEQDYTDIISDFISRVVNGEKVSVNVANIMQIIPEGLKVMTLLNGYFAIFDGAKDYTPTDKEHLFDSKLTNYEYIDQFGDKTLDEVSPYIKDKAFNINYLVANLDYYFGSLKSINDNSTYRLQQGLFLLLNDPTLKTKELPKEFNNVKSVTGSRNSVLIDAITKIGLKTAKELIKDDSTKEIIDGIIQNPSTIELIESILLKPLILGIVDGGDYSVIIKLIKTAIPIIINFAGKDLDDNLKKTIEYEAKNFLDNILENKMIMENPVKFLLQGNFRSLIKGSQIFTNDMLDKIFGKGKDANLGVLINKPLNVLLGYLGVPGFEGGKLPGIGDTYLMMSIPGLISKLSSYLNTIDINSQNHIYKYKDDDEMKSLKAFNINFDAIQSFIKALIGTKDDGSDNIISTLLNDLLLNDQNGFKVSYTTNDKTNKTITIGLNKIMNDLGYVSEHTYKKDSIFGSIFSLALPKLNETNDQGSTENTYDDENIVINKDNTKIDLVKPLYSSIVDIVLTLNNPTRVKPLINKMLVNEETFEYKIDEKEFEYLDKEKTEIKKFGIRVTFKNPYTGLKTKYLFRLERTSNIETFAFKQITTNK